MAARLLLYPTAKQDVIDGGSGSITGTNARVTSEGNPVACKVRLYDRITGRLARETFSGTDGYYSFYRLDTTREWQTLAINYTNAKNAAIDDRVFAT